MTRLTGLLAALALLLTQASSVAAAEVLTDTGTHGAWSVTDTDPSPAAKCAYGPEIAPDYAWFRWVRIAAPHVFATDAHPTTRDAQKVSLQFKIQHQPYLSGDPWRTVAKSGVQHATAYDNQAAPLKPMKLYWKGEKTPATDPLGDDLRVVVTIKWYTPGGSVAGKIQYLPDHYALKAFGGTSPGVYGNCFAEASAG